MWEHAAALASEHGAVALRATPGESETRHSFGVLHDLFRDTDLDEHRLRAPVRDALAAVLLRETATGPVDSQLVEVGVHDLLAALAADRRVVVLVDDVQWADAGSLQALTFAARRLDRAPIQFVLTRRDGFGRTALEAQLGRRGLREVEPQPLSAEGTARLLSHDLELTLSPRVLRLVHEQSGGNPLFVLEIGRALMLRGVPAAGKPLGIPTEMTDVLGLRVRDLAEDQRALLLAVAIDGQLTGTDLVALAGLEPVERSVRDRLIPSPNRAAPGPGTRCWPQPLGRSRRRWDGRHSTVAWPRSSSGPSSGSGTWPSPRPSPTRSSPTRCRPAPGWPATGERPRRPSSWPSSRWPAARRTHRSAPHGCSTWRRG